MTKTKRSRRSAKSTTLAHAAPALAFGAITMAGVIAPVEVFAADVNVTTNTNRVDLDTKSGTTADIGAGVTVKNDQPTVGPGTVQALNSAWTVTNNGTIDGRLDDSLKTNDGIKLGKGGTVVNNGTITGFYGVLTTTGTGAVTNSGSITGFLRGVEMQAGGSVVNNAGATIKSANGGVNVTSAATGSVVNSGTIDGGLFNSISLQGGGTVDNKASGQLNGAIVIGGVGGSVTNAGTLINNGGTSAIAVKSGTITNSGTVLGQTVASMVTIVQTSGGVITNSGVITNNQKSSFATAVEVTKGTFTNEATGVVSAYYNAVYMSGSGGPGTLTNAGVIKNDAVVAGSGAIEMAGGGTVTNSGTITGVQQGLLNGSGAITITNSGTISGSTALQLNGAGLSTVINKGTINGKVNLSTGDGVLQVFTGSKITGAVDARAGTDTLRLSGAGAETYDSSYLNFEVLDVDAAGGTWTHTGTAAFTGGTTVTNGTLIASGTLTSAVTVKSGATLKGAGTVGSTTVQGIIAPGNSIGQINLAGDLTIQAGSTYQVEVDPGGIGDKIAATGKASITGGTLQVLANAGKYNPTTEYVIITAPGGVSGSGFTALTSNYAFLTPTVRYDPTQVVLTLKVSSIDFASIAQTPNQTAVGNAVSALGPGTPVFDAILPLTAADARTALNALSGEIYAAEFGALVDDSRHVREAMMERVRENADGPEDGAVTLWAEGFGAWGDLDGTSQTVGTSRDIWGFFAGAERNAGNWRLGILGGYQSAALDMSDRASTGEVSAYHIGLYGGGMIGPVSIRAGFDYSEADLDTSRTVAFTGFSQGLASTSGGRVSQLFGEAGYGFKAGGGSLEPYAGFGWIGLDVDPATETGGSAALNVAGGDGDLTFGTLGVRGATGGEGPWSFRGAASWRHYFRDITPGRSAMFAAGTTAFSVVSTPLAQDAGLIEAGVEWRSGRTSISAFYSGQFADGQTDHGLRLTISIGLGG